jgi:CheY-like chemotaxis protein
METNSLSYKNSLVIEDEPVISRICKRTLMAIGFDVEIALNGLVAKEMVDEKKYDLILSDIRTPGMNGIEFYRYLEQKHPDMISNVIFTTGDILSSNIENFLNEIQRAFLPKPFTPEQLTKVIMNDFANREGCVLPMKNRPSFVD